MQKSLSKKFLFSFLNFIIFFFTLSLGWAEPLEKIAKKLSEGCSQLKNKRVAVLPFSYHDGKESAGSTIISERLITKIAKLKKLEVVERSLLEKVFKELKLQSSGAVDDSSAKELGKVLGVEAIVSGTLIDLDQKEVEVNARLIKAETGEILVAASGEVEKFWKEEFKSQSVLSAKTYSTPQPLGIVQNKEESPLVLSNRDVARTERPISGAPFHPDSSMEAAPELPEEPPMESVGGMPPTMMEENFTPDHSPEMWSKGIWFGPLDSLLVESNVPWDFIRSPLGQQFVEGLRLLKNGDSKTALKKFEALRQTSSERPAILKLAQLGYGMALFQEGQSDKALQEINSVIQESSWPRVRATAHFVLGRVYESLGKVELAQQNYLEVIRLIPYRTLMVRHASRQLRVLRGESVPPFRNEETQFKPPTLYDGPPHFRRPNYQKRSLRRRLP